MMKKLIFCSATVISMALSMTAAHASGSDGGGGAETGDAAAYNMGKGVYAQKFACATCSMAGKSLDATMAKKLLDDKMDKMNSGVSQEERHALEVYLMRRFKL
jgi:hypothetical protein